jgi:hypothetical protein
MIKLLLEHQLTKHYSTKKDKKGRQIGGRPTDPPTPLPLHVGDPPHDPNLTTLGDADPACALFDAVPESAILPARAEGDPTMTEGGRQSKLWPGYDCDPPADRIPASKSLGSDKVYQPREWQRLPGGWQPCGGHCRSHAPKQGHGNCTAGWRTTGNGGSNGCVGGVGPAVSAHLRRRLQIE